jgi:hypothetical protein
MMQSNYNFESELTSERFLSVSSSRSKYSDKKNLNFKFNSKDKDWQNKSIFSNNSFDESPKKLFKL